MSHWRQVNHTQVYLKDDMVIREGEVSREMYFIKSGAVQVPTLSST